MNRITKIHGFAVTIAATVSGVAAAAAPMPAYVAATLRWVERPPLEMALDRLLRPGEVMVLAGVRPGMRVVSLMPDSGYYMRIMSGIVGPSGKVYAVIPQSNSAGEMGRSVGPLVREFGEGDPRTRLQRVTGRAYQPNIAQNTDVMWEWVDGKQYPNDLRYGNFAVPEQIDVLVTAYDYHVFESPAFSNTNMHRFLGAIYRHMKNNGVVIVIDNRAQPGMALSDAVALNRMNPEVVKTEMTQTGFVLEADSPILARADDDRTKMAEDVFLTRTPKAADAFVLKFRKPKNAPNTDQRPKDPLKLLQGFFGNTIEVTGGDHSLHFIHADGTYQEMRNASFDSGNWFFNADGWNCRYRRGRSFADCATSPHEYDNRHVGDVWEAPHGHYVVKKGYDYSLILGREYPDARALPLGSPN